MTRRRVFTLFGVVLACGGGVKGPADGTLEAVVRGLASDLTRVVITVEPGSVTRELVPDASGVFSGSFTVSPGDYDVRADAYAGTVLAGSTSSLVTVPANGHTLVDLTILDARGPSSVPDHGPVITGFMAPLSSVVGVSSSVSASAFDADGDALAWSWAASPSGCGTFGSASSAATSFVAAAVGTCRITASVFAGGASDSRSADVTVAAATGVIDVQGTYVAQPTVRRITLQEGGVEVWAVDRAGGNATSPATFVRGRTYGLVLTFDAMPDGAAAVEDGCGGSVAVPALEPASTSVSGTWTPAMTSPAYCVLTARLTRQGLSDAFPVVLRFAP